MAGCYLHLHFIINVLHWVKKTTKTVNEQCVLMSDHVSHTAVETAGHSAHDTSVPADVKVRRPSFAFCRIQVPAQSRLEQDRTTVVVVIVR